MKKAFLIGAGFSYDLGMPLAFELTETFLSLFTKRSVETFCNVLSLNNPYGNERPINKTALKEALVMLLDYKENNGNNYEEILSNIQDLRNNHEKTLSDKDSYSYVFSIMYDIIWQILYLYQVKSYELIYEKNKEFYRKIEDLFGEEECWIFSLNHDLYVELLALDFKIPISYGDTDSIIFPLNNIDKNTKINFSYTLNDNFFKEKMNFHKKDKSINLVKLHGGLGEFEYKDKKLQCNLSLDNRKSSFELINDFKNYNNMAYYHNGVKVPSGKDRIVTNSLGELDIIVKSMLTGGNKYSKTSNEKKGEEKLKIFSDILTEIDELTVIGYGFGDNHINFRLSNAMVLNPNLSISIIEPMHFNTPEVLNQFDYDNRIKKAICTATQWFNYYKEKTWNQDLNKSIIENNELRNKIKSEVLNSLYKLNR